MDLSGGTLANAGINAPASNPLSAFNGQPFTYLLPDGNDQTNQRPDIIPGVPLTFSHPRPITPVSLGTPLINAAAFQAPPTDANGSFLRFGNSPNGVVRAPNSWQIDIELMKATKLSERVALEFSAQAFNIFNHVQLADPGALNLIYDPYNPAAASSGFLTPQGGFGVISSFVNFNSNNDNAASPNTGTGLPRQIQLMVRVKF
jgi:hypothetical protein